MMPAKGDDDGRLGSSPAKVGLIAVLLVLAVVMARARAEHVAPHVSGTAGGIVLALIRGAGVAVLVAGVVLLVWGRHTVKAQLAVQGGRRKPMSEDQRRRTIIAAMIGVASALLYQLIIHALGQPTRDRPGPPAQVGSPAPDNGTSFFDQTQQQHAMPEAGPGTYVMLALALVTLGLLAYALVRRPNVLPPDEPFDEEPLDDPVAVARVVEAGRAAIADHAITDPREAVVACFAAMERALAGMGANVRPRDADTPEEVLRRGIEGASLPEAPSRLLLALFHRARFSAHPIWPADRESADEALGALLTGLDQRARAHPGADR